MTEKTILLAQKATPPIPVPAKPAMVPAPPPTATNEFTIIQPQGVGHVMRDLPLTSWDLAVIAGVTLLAALLALVPRALITRYLVSQRATPSAARSAGWSAWLVFVTLAFVSLVGALGNLWAVLLFWLPASIVLLLLLILTLVLFFRARRTHR